ncbi:MAG: transcriptional regulator [Planctomycetota bacterium]|nr:transcriptional regulator [Planctomycetota bacterium]
MEGVPAGVRPEGGSNAECREELGTRALEGEKYSPSLEVAFRIARVFGKPLEEVFQYEEQRRR